MKRFIITTTILLWIALAVFAFYYVNRPVDSVAKSKVDYSLTSVDFYSQFDQNESEANEKYLGKVIEISGTVQETATDEQGNLSVTLAGDEMFGVTCKLPEHVSQKIKKGDVVTVKGICSGKLMDVVLVNCNLETS